MIPLIGILVSSCIQRSIIGNTIGITISKTVFNSPVKSADLLIRIGTPASNANLIINFNVLIIAGFILYSPKFSYSIPDSLN